MAGFISLQNFVTNFWFLFFCHTNRDKFLILKKLSQKIIRLKYFWSKKRDWFFVVKIFVKKAATF